MQYNIKNMGIGLLGLFILIWLFINYSPDDWCIWCGHDSHKTYVNGKLVK